MLLKIGDRIINSDLIVYATYYEEEDERLTLCMVNVNAGDARDVTEQTFRGDEGKALWAALSDKATDVMQKSSGGSFEFRA